MINYEIAIASKLQRIPENKLTREIIIPLLESIGYHKVEFFGGPAEEGKDLVFWERDKLDDTRLFVAQVKHFKFTNKASDEKALQTIINQMVQCFLKALPYSDKTMHHPAEVFLITSYPVDTRTLLTRFNGIPQLRDQQIRIIDGVKLAVLLLKYQSCIVSDLLGFDYEISSKIEPTLNNKILLSALGYMQQKELKSIYTDLDFSLGKTTTTLFFNSNFQPSLRKLELDRSELNILRNLLLQLGTEYNLNFLNKSLEELETLSKENVKQKTSEKRLSNLLEEADAEKDSRRQLYYKKRDEVEKYRTIHKDFKVHEKWSQLSAEAEDAYSDSLKAERKRTELQVELQRLLHKKAMELCKVDIAGSNLVAQLLEKRKWIESKVAEFNNKRPGIDELRAFILRCKSIITTTDLLFKNQKFFNCMGILEHKFMRKDLESTRFKLPIDQFFDTGLNFTVLGEAGAGKTTSLQMYFFNRQNNSEKLILWLPLAQVIQDALQNSNYLREQDLKDNFEKHIFNHLVRIGISVSWGEFVLHLNSRRIIFLFDGIDEAIKPAPWLPEVISNIAVKYKENAQVIVTSRMSGDYLNDIPFFTVTLLPFTPKQRNKFIEQWFAGENKEETVQKIKLHLNKHIAISAIITNPLLATTLCVLANHQLPLPKTEIDLYDNRVKLLTGNYDNVKRIVSRVTVTQQTLEAVAQKLAFYLHFNNKREDYISFLESNIRKITMNEIDSRDAIIALNELVDPCNLIVPMSEDGKFGFGHLKYQEHLCARELLTNRGIDVVPLLKHAWWREVLLLFARMNRKLEWLVRLAGEHEICSEYEVILREMIAVRPKEEQQNLLSLFGNYLLLENDESFANRSSIDSNNIGFNGFDDFN